MAGGGDVAQGEAEVNDISITAHHEALCLLLHHGMESQKGHKGRKNYVILDTVEQTTTIKRTDPWGRFKAF